MKAPVSVLVAEDNPDDVLLLQRAFARAGFGEAIHYVRDGLEAKECLEAALQTEVKPRPIPKVLLLDLRMPRLDGFELLKWIRQQPQLHHLAVVVLSGVRNQKDIDRAYKLGANSYVVKPGELEPLVEFLRLVHAYWAEWNEVGER